MTLFELCSCLRGLLEMQAVTERFAVGLLASKFGITRFAASLLLMSGTVA